MNYIKITVREKRAKCNGRERIVCGNSDYVIKFDFDDEWAAYDTKTARFVYDGGKYTDVQFTGDEVGVPVLRDTRTVSVGCYAGDIRTTTAALIQAVPCCTDPDGTPADPAPDVYNQLMERFNTTVRTAEQSFTDAEKAQARKNIGAMDETLGLRAQEVTYTMFGRTVTAKIYIETGTLTPPADDATDEIKTKYNGIVYYICNVSVGNPAEMEGVLKAFILLYQSGLLSAEFRAYSDPFKSKSWLFTYSSKRKRLGAVFSKGDRAFSCWQEEDTGEIKHSTVESYAPLKMNVTTDGQFVLPQQTVKADPTADMQIATKHYVDNAIEAEKEKWEKVADITVDEAVTSILAEFDNCKKVKIILFVQHAATGNMLVFPNTTTTPGGRDRAQIGAFGTSNIPKATCEIIDFSNQKIEAAQTMYISEESVMQRGDAYLGNLVINAGTMQRRYIEGNYAAGIDEGINKILVSAPANAIGATSRLTIYGVKA